MQNFLNLTPMLSAAFLQHYGLPTELLDVTSKLDVAAFFAAFGTPGVRGAIRVFPMKVIANQAVVVDLTAHHAAERPRRQSAYGLFHRRFININPPDAVSELQLHWFEFTLTASDVERYRPQDWLLDAHTDKVAGTLQLILDSFEKCDDLAAWWLADHITPAPFVTTVEDYYDVAKKQPNTVSLVSLNERACLSMQTPSAKQIIGNGSRPSPRRGGTFWIPCLGGRVGRFEVEW